MLKLVLPFLLLIIFLLESVFSSVVPVNLFWESSIAVPHFLFIVLLFITIYYNSIQAAYFSMLFGFLFDIVYTELLGVYLFSYPLLSFLVSNAMRILQVNLFIVSVLVLFAVTALEYYVYGLLTLLGRADLPLQIFTTDRVMPTLILNYIFVLLVCFPLKKYLLRLLAATEEK